MDTTTRTYPVVGGWHAEDIRLRIACFGRDEAEARGNLDRSRERFSRLAVEVERRRAEGTLYGPASLVAPVRRAIDPAGGQKLRHGRSGEA